MDASLVSPGRPVRLKNRSCCYCGAPLTRENATIEHVIGRRFVPRGTLENAWNLILRACQLCNNRKSDLEDDLSAITMQGLIWDVSLGDRFRHDAARKATGSMSRRTGTLVGESIESLRLEASPMAGVRMTFDLVAPAQADEQRLVELARLQLSAFFYLLTYRSETGTGDFSIGNLLMIDYARRSDWGNSLQQGFMKHAQRWRTSALVVTAQGFFKAVIRRSPHGACWSWALEWNANLRLVGFFGDEDAATEATSELPPPKMSPFIGQPDGSRIRFRSDVPLRAEDDALFSG